MRKELRKNRNLRDIALLLVALSICMATALFFCVQKKGFHEDEYYSYYSTCRTAGFWIENQTWMEKQDYLQEYVVKPGEGFRYDFVKQVQSWDVHPPFYYWVLHTVCSLFPGVFSKWFGLGINLFCYGISLCLFIILSKQILSLLPDIEEEEKNKITAGFLFTFGMSCGILSGVTFIRMYMLLTCFVLGITILHIRQMRSDDRIGISFLLSIWVCTYLGFLTQYYYMIYLFFLAAFFFLYQVFYKRRWAQGFCYGVVLVSALMAAYFTYPACLGQMFKGQRGGQAVGNFFDFSNTLNRFCFFMDLYDRFMWAGALIVVILGMLLFFLYSVWKKRSRQYAVALQKPEIFLMLLFALAGYFVAVSKTALLLGDTSVRYQMPVYGIAQLCIFTWILVQGKVLGISRKARNRLLLLLLLLLTVGNFYGYAKKNVAFLYPEDEKQIQFAREHESDPVVYLYDPAQTWCVWDSTDELLEYPAIYFAEQTDTASIEDKTILEADKTVVYVSSLTNEAERYALELLSKMKQANCCELQYTDKFCQVYLLYHKP